MNARADSLNIQIDQGEARRIAETEYAQASDPKGFSAEKQASHVDATMRLFKATDDERTSILNALAEAQRPTVLNSLPADTASLPMQIVEIIGHRGELAGVGKFFNDWQDPLATAGRLGTRVGEAIAGNAWAKYGLMTVEAITTPALFVGRALFDATDFGKAFNKKLDQVSGEVLDAGTAFVNQKGRIGDIQKSAEIIGGTMLAVGLAVGGVRGFTRLASNIGDYLKKLSTSVDVRHSPFERQLSHGSDLRVRGSLSGSPESHRPNANDDLIRSINRQNESADILARDYDLNVAHLPSSNKKGGHPDISINGRKADVYAPGGKNTQTMLEKMQDKVNRQAPDIVLNLSDSPVSANQILDHLKRQPVNGLQHLYIIKGKDVMLRKF